MNEQIKELIDQATTEEHDGFRYFDKKKFAKLIVKECMDAVGNDPMALPYIQRIKAKFGVEYYEPIEKAFGGK